MSFTNHEIEVFKQVRGARDRGVVAFRVDMLDGSACRNNVENFFPNLLEKLVVLLLTSADKGYPRREMLPIDKQFYPSHWAKRKKNKTYFLLTQNSAWLLANAYLGHSLDYNPEFNLFELSIRMKSPFGSKRWARKLNQDISAIKNPGSKSRALVESLLRDMNSGRCKVDVITFAEGDWRGFRHLHDSMDLEEAELTAKSIGHFKGRGDLVMGNHTKIELDEKVYFMQLGMYSHEMENVTLICEDDGDTESLIMLEDHEKIIVANEAECDEECEY
ncbi:hypothetical protein OXX80_006394 [Metschnikowia pulcherrima]